MLYPLGQKNSFARLYVYLATLAAILIHSLEGNHLIYFKNTRLRTFYKIW